jgi:hypothetical protein
MVERLGRFCPLADGQIMIMQVDVLDWSTRHTTRYTQ